MAESGDIDILQGMSEFRFKIASPCAAKWEGMQGTERVRHCAACKTNVYNVAALSRDDVAKLLQLNPQGMCLRIYERTDGTVMLRDCPVALAAARRGLVKTAVGIACVAVTVLGFFVMSPDTEGAANFRERMARIETHWRKSQLLGGVINAVDPLPPAPVPPLRPPHKRILMGFAENRPLDDN